jgi:hypothetical protein
MIVKTTAERLMPRNINMSLKSWPQYIDRLLSICLKRYRPKAIA